MEKYEQPGERLVSKVPTKEFKDNYDAIFGKKETWLERRERKQRCRRRRNMTTAQTEAFSLNSSIISVTRIVKAIMI